MNDFLPKDVLDGLRSAKMRGLKKRATRSVQIGDEVYAILDFSPTGFAVDVETTPYLRGLIDIYEGSRHLCQALIIASEEDGDLMRYEFKRNTAAADRPPLDFEEATPEVSGYLT
ncbi:hypothetical protein OE810_07720 [Rhodobacteraceae bacterium XHP0102]|nr:hypothetical protein [Rhodobacteraceae bacterium XHP0102]